MTKRLPVIGLALLASLFLFGPTFAHHVHAAALPDNALSNQNLSATISTQDLTTLITRIINVILIVAGIIAFIYLLFGGFQYLTAGANDDKASAGQKAITNAIIGLVIIFLSYAVVAYVTGRLNQASSGSINSNNTAVIPGS